ncbi:hypothetical protein SAY87_008296 [Trapa incisa]|uniref:non-specific serine/threonine protein kinase n=1 Tax=Trapa incisa TaxID=236973 RepID=A0AAN7QG85_9MYRT|nr:hypothetical protein SAY87_008296 [Trapa incisa]
MGNCVGSHWKKQKLVTSEPVVLSEDKHLSAFSSPSKSFQAAILPAPRSDGDILSSSHSKPFTYQELKSATRNFRDLLGEGGFGCVYEGWLDQHTLGSSKPGPRAVVAVKKLKPQGFQGHKEWLSEVKYLGQLHHPNLVKLIGYCLEGNNRLLVYEYMPKGSLENHLFQSGDAPPLSWAMRMKVAIGAARGLSFLHELEHQVIYRDFKASNILLDSEFNAKLSDFGLAKAGPTGDETHVTTQVLGTHGYAAPEYIATGRLTVKCDVYSFGVVLLELISGRRAVDKTKVGMEQNLVEWVKSYLGDKRKLFRIMDIKLEGQYPQKGALMAAFLALGCLGDAKFRPSMAEVLDHLEKIPVPKKATKPLDKSDRLLVVSVPSPRSPQQHAHYHLSPTNLAPAAASPIPPQFKSPPLSSITH